MSDGTKIEWTDATANVVNGCTVVSPGCALCYAMKQAHRFPVRQGLTRPSPSGMTWTGEVRFHEPALQQVLRWTRPRRIFWNAHGDLFHEKVPVEWIDRCLAAMGLTGQHTHQLLTKRPERQRDYFNDPGWRERVWDLLDELKPSSLWNGNVYQGRHHLQTLGYFPNVWLGTSVEDQRRADERIPVLLDTPGALHWLSCEPLLGMVELGEWLPSDPMVVDDTCDSCGERHHGRCDGAAIGWVVVGGESGPGSRPMHPSWARRIRDACDEAGVPFLFKQWGNWAPFDAEALLARCAPEQGNRPKLQTDIVIEYPEGQCGQQQHMWRLSKKEAGRELDGLEHDGYPERKPAWTDQ